MLRVLVASARERPRSRRACLLAALATASALLVLEASGGALGRGAAGAASARRLRPAAAADGRASNHSSRGGRSERDRSDDDEVLTKAAGLTWTGQIRSKNHPSKCLDVAGEERNGSRLQLSNCWDRWHVGVRAPGQLFTWNSLEKKLRWAGYVGYPGADRFCVDVFNHKSENGNHLQLWECADWNSDQSFDVPWSGEGKIRWSNHPEKCVDVRDHSFTQGNPIQIWDCIEGNTDQVFTMPQPRRLKVGNASADGGR